MRRRAFSLVELILVIAIISVLAALISPALWSVKHSANMTLSMSRLRQLGVAVQMYQADYQLQRPSVRELPPFGYVYSEFMGFDKNFFVSPCGYKDDIEGNLMGLSYQYWGGFDVNEHLFQEHGDSSTLFSDPDCNESADQWRSLHRSKRGLAVLYSGQVVNHYKPGDTGKMAWWSAP